MAFRLTTDDLAERIDQLESGEPDLGLVKTFFRQGKKDGRRLLDHGNVSAYVSDAVDLACRKIAEEFVARRSTLERQLAEVADEVRVGSGNPVAALETPDRAEADGELAGSLAVWRLRRRQQEEAERLAAEQRARDAAEAAQRQVVALEAELESLADGYALRVDAAHAAGSLLWARYCTGYEEGQARRRSPEDELVGPDPEIDFAVPNELTDRMEDR